MENNASLMTLIQQLPQLKKSYENGHHQDSPVSLESCPVKN